jgi:hypothetical protein
MPRASGHTKAIAPLRLLELTLVFCVSVVGVARPAWAGGATNYTYKVLFDTDNNPATGCNVPVENKTVSPLAEINPRPRSAGCSRPSGAGRRCLRPAVSCRDERSRAIRRVDSQAVP